MCADLVECRTYTLPDPPEVNRTGQVPPSHRISRSIVPMQTSVWSHYPTAAAYGAPTRKLKNSVFVP